ncbi:hypothetical protein GCM10022239_16830 [Leifsonia bigeumensis]|uniref:DNA translocase FtsK 4TM region domain-containing protein n=2 Tax=Leifsonella bigeumensis TaxID=433643 RepID=A0ABP7FKR4_9MICO
MRGFASLFGRRGVVAAAIAALIVVTVEVVLQLVITSLGTGILLMQGSGSGNVPYLFPASLVNLVLGVLPFAIGVFLSLWLLAPVAAELHIAHVITRALLAVAAGALIVFIVRLLGSLFTNFDESAGYVFGWASGLFSTVSSNAGWAFAQSLYSALTTAINLIPLTVLACVLLWVWLRDHPAKHPVAGLIDEV